MFPLGRKTARIACVLLFFAVLLSTAAEETGSSSAANPRPSANIGGRSVFKVARYGNEASHTTASSSTSISHPRPLIGHHNNPPTLEPPVESEDVPQPEVTQTAESSGRALETGRQWACVGTLQV
eukprot:1950356-Pyramimonas_sp.AAC.2